jgi:hypothetical protein
LITAKVDLSKGGDKESRKVLENDHASLRDRHQHDTDAPPQVEDKEKPPGERRPVE